MSRRIFLSNFILSLLIVFLCLGCGSDNEITRNNFKIFLITMDKEIPYWAGIDKGCRKAVEELGGIDYKWIAPKIREPDKQSECIDKAVAEGADAILISPISAIEINASLRKATESGVKIIYVDSMASYEGVVTLATDNMVAGKIAAETMLKALKDAGIKSGTIGVATNESTSQNTILRDRGFREVFEKTDFIVAPTVYLNNNPQIVKDDVKNHLEYVGYFGANQNSTVALGKQVKESGAKMIVVGFDTAEETLELIKDGFIYATLEQNTQAMGYDGIKFAVKVLDGLVSEENIIEDTGVSVITKETLNESDR